MDLERKNDDNGKFSIIISRGGCDEKSYSFKVLKEAIEYFDKEVEGFKLSAVERHEHEEMVFIQLFASDSDEPIKEELI